MNLFRISVLVLALSLTAGAVVHIRLKNWNYAYKINKLYEQHQHLQREYIQAQLELARYQSPDTLLERLRELKLPLEGYGLTDPNTPEKAKPSPSTMPTSKKSAKPNDKHSSKPAASTAKKKHNPSKQNDE